MTCSAALTTETHEALAAHLARADGQEDLCFALYRPSEGASRTTALVHELVLPRPGEREVHGNVAFTSEYFLRAAAAAAEADAGLVLVHSHPRGRGWQNMSRDDIDAERGHAGQTLTITEMPLIGMTLGTGEMSWSARSWPSVAPGEFTRRDFESVRVVGDRLRYTFNPALRPPPPTNERQIRTVSAWGDAVQADIARTRVAIVGTGSVGFIVAEALARTGVEHIVLIDFDSVKTHNLDRLLYADQRDVRLASSKVETLRRALLRSASADNPRIDAHELSILEGRGLRAALDCDVIFSCVDRPWGRSALNFVAYAHLVPVIDGGINVVTRDDRLERADWKAHVAAPGRACMECLRQYDPGLVSVERDGYLEDATYIKGLPKGHPLIANENVFAFSTHTAAMEVLQMLSMIIAPYAIADIGAHNYHFVTGELDTTFPTCNANCPYADRLLGSGNSSGIAVTGHHPAAEAERAARHARQRRLRVRIARTVDTLLQAT